MVNYTPNSEYLMKNLPTEQIVLGLKHKVVLGRTSLHQNNLSPYFLFFRFLLSLSLVVALPSPISRAPTIKSSVLPSINHKSGRSDDVIFTSVNQAKSPNRSKLQSLMHCSLFYPHTF